MKSIQVLEEQICAARSVQDVWNLLWQWQGDLVDGLDVVAQHAPVLDEPLVRTLLVGLNAPALLVLNPAFPASLEDMTATWLARRIQGESRKDDRTAAATALKAIMKRGRILSGSEAFGILEPIALRKDKRKFTDRTSRAVESLLACPELPRDLLDQLDVVLDHERETALHAMLAAHPAATPEFLRRVLIKVFGIETPQPGVLQALIETPHVRADAELVPALLRSAAYWRSVPALREFLKEAPAEAWLALLRQEYKKPENMGSIIVQEHGDRIGPLLTREDLHALLASPSSALREFALRWSSRQGPAAEHAGTTPRDPSRPRATPKRS